MRFLFTVFVLSIFTISCMDMDQINQDLCIPVVCGEIQNNKANLALFNDSGVDFDVLYYDISGQSDSIGFFPLKQYTCWINIDSLNTDYFIAKGLSDNQVYKSDTLWLNQNSEAYTSGVFVLEIYHSNIDNKLNLQFVEDYSGECKGL